MRALAALALAAGLAAGPGAAQVAEPSADLRSAPLPPPGASPVLVFDQEALWSGSAWGRRVTAEIEARRAGIAAENDRIAHDLEAEDAALTEARKTLPPQEFRARADAFDARVQKLRADRDLAARDLAQALNAEREGFLRAALPVIGREMDARGGDVLLDRQMVFLSAGRVDITDALISAVDHDLGAGPTPKPEPTPEPSQAATPTPTPEPTPTP